MKTLYFIILPVEAAHHYHQFSSGVHTSQGVAEQTDTHRSQIRNCPCELAFINVKHNHVHIIDIAHNLKFCTMLIHVLSGICDGCNILDSCHVRHNHFHIHTAHDLNFCNVNPLQSHFLCGIYDGCNILDSCQWKRVILCSGSQA